MEFRHEIRIVAYMKTKTNNKVMKMNTRKNSVYLNCGEKKVLQQMRGQAFVQL